jgi:hypothetical protein
VNIVTGYELNEASRVYSSQFTMTNSDTTGKTKDVYFMRQLSNGAMNTVLRLQGTGNEYVTKVLTSASPGTFSVKIGIYGIGTFTSSVLSFTASDWVSNSVLKQYGQTFTNNKAGNHDVYILKIAVAQSTEYTNPNWAQVIGGTENDYVDNIVESYDGSTVYVYGRFLSKTIKMNGAIYNKTSSDVTNEDLFFASLKTVDGTYYFATVFGGLKTEQIVNITDVKSAEGTPGVIVAGHYNSSTLIAQSKNLTNAGSNDIFIIKYTSSGTIQFALSFGGSGDEQLKATLSVPGGVVLVGLFKQSTFQVGEYTLSNNATTYAAFIVLLKHDGTFGWAKQLDGSFDIDALITLVRNTNGFVIAGQYSNSLSVTPYAIPISYASSGSSDVFSASFFLMCLVNNVQCGGFGTCNTATQICTCIKDYIVAGVLCVPRQCYGVDFNSTQVCSSHGVCNSNGTCACSTGYSGSQCDQRIKCYGIEYQVSNVCSGHGNCTGSDKCVCNAGFSGNQCNETRQCYGKTSDACNKHGTCIANDNCQCDTNWSGNQCQTPICYNVIGTNNSVCSDHGSCTAPDQCSCSVGYFGDKCQSPICYGVKATNTSAVCNGHGSCIDKDDCRCIQNYFGDTCDHYSCFGKNSTDASVCFSHGTCVSYNECHCEYGYTGTECTPICFGVNATSSNVCSRNGNCTDYNQCSCSSGYSGQNCSLVFCDSIRSDDNKVCNGRGVCQSPDQCTCASGYTGDYCEFVVCYSYNSSDTKVCSGNGTCMSPNNCSCNKGYTGTECNITICDGISSTYSNVCSGNGICITPDTCSCSIGYYGDNCQNFTCNSIGHTNQGVCSGFGECIDLDTCNCSSGYTSQYCNNTICGNYSSDQVMICSSHGSCVAPEDCECNHGYTGHFCQYYLCSGVASNNGSVCSSHGTCIGEDSCRCTGSYYGDKCDQFSCFKIDSNDTTVCSGHGSCVDTDQCSCDQFYSGANCSVIQCYSIKSTSETVCSGHGSCTGPDSCRCESGYNGNNCSLYSCFDVPYNNMTVCSAHGDCISADQCSCDQQYSGMNCSVFHCYTIESTAENVCSGHGICADPDSCDCDEGDWTGDRCDIPICYGVRGNASESCTNHGICVFPDVCQCSTGWTGNTCNLPICFNFTSVDNMVCSNHGSCIAPDNCSCTQYYEDSSCNITRCNDTRSDDSAVCSRRGSCIAPDECGCDHGYTGQLCESYLCSKILYNNATVCSYHGTCISPDVCECDGDYYGDTCELFNCFDIAVNNTTVCSENGYCDMPDTCICDTGYTGQNCALFICYGIVSTNDSVCSSHGTCIGVDSCMCTGSYFGDKCDQFSCFKIDSNDTTVCSGHGSCVDTDQCSCGQFYSGANCSVTHCYSIESTSETVCSGHGSCTGPDTCECDSGYSENSCNFYSCFGISYNNGSVCTSHGACISTEKCQCNAGYSGMNCSQFSCFDRSEDDVTVCSGHGLCVGIDQCSCDSLYYGSNCSVTHCYSIESTSTNVCSGNGYCIMPDICSCDTGYIGNNCDTFTCYGITSNNGSVCSSHGSCVEVDNCQCITGYTGKNCDQLSCFGVASNDATVCSEHGSCIGFDVCSCNQFYSGSNCSITQCFSIDSTSATVCSGHGICTDLNICKCHQNEWTGNKCDIPICFGIAGNISASCSNHGTCISPDVCQCSVGWIGSVCELPVCFNHTSTDDSVCSSHGTCIAPDNCSCDQYYEDINCNISLCFKKRSDDATVCSGHGTCWDNAPNCSCLSGFGGDTCDQYACNGKVVTDTGVCSSHGNCMPSNLCLCSEHYLGSDCEIHTCFSTLSNASNVCSSHGVCSGVDTCDCQNGYSGHMCQTVRTCNGVDFFDINSCSSRGNCTDTGCECHDGYYGQNCEEFTCFEAKHNDSSVCSGHGECIAYNSCQCTSKYAGEKCDKAVCFSYKEDDPLVCNGHGACSGEDICECDGLYYGLNCTQFNCFGVNKYNQSVCNNNGQCLLPDVCSCKNGVTGNICDTFECYGIDSQSASVCSNSGTCVNVDVCICHSGKGGLQCDLSDFSCYGQLFNSSAVCSSHGKCIGSNKCLCDSEWVGDVCDIPTCDGKYDTPDTCSGHGSCVGLNNCVCSEIAISGYWSGATCNECLSGFKGDNCNTSTCDPEITCSTHGVCEDGGCKCHHNDSNGYWTGEHCNVCSTSYYGISCKIKCDDAKCVYDYSDPFTFTGSGALIGKFNSPSNTTLLNTYSCKDIAHPSTLSLLGHGPSCSWVHDNTTNTVVLKISFGLNPLLVPGDQIKLNLLYQDTTKPAAYVDISTVGPPTSWLIKPVANIVSLGNIESCLDLVLNGKSSFSFDGHGLNYQWNCTSGGNIDAINAYLQMQTSSEVIIPSTLMTIQNSSYTFSLVVTSIFNVTSVPAIRNVRKLAVGVPQLTLIGAGSYKIGDAFRITGGVVGTVCNPDVSTFTFKWTQISGAQTLALTPVSSSTTSSIVFGSSTLTKDGTYTFMLSISTPTQNNIVSEAVTIVMIYPDLVATLGGNIVGTIVNPISVQSKCTDPAKTSEAEIIQWSCTSSDRNITLPSTSAKVLLFPANYLKNGTYTLTLTCMKGQRSASTSIILDLSSSTSIPSVVLAAINSVVNSNEKLSVTVTSVYVSGKGALAGKWSIKSAFNGDVTSSLLTPSQLTLKAITIAEGTLKQGDTYIFRYTVENGGSTGYSEVKCIVNLNPIPGTFVVSPKNGTEGTTRITMTLSGWTDTDLPLIYTYSYIDSKNTIQPLYTTRNNDPTYSTKYIPAVNANGNVVVVGTVTDSYGGSYSIQDTIQITPLSSSAKLESSKSQVGQLQELLNSGSVNDALSVIVSVGSMMSSTGTSSDKTEIVSKMMDTLTILLQSEDVQSQIALVVNALFLTTTDPSSMSPSMQKQLQASLELTVNNLPSNADQSVYTKIADALSSGIIASKNLSSTDADSVGLSTLDRLNTIAGKLPDGYSVTSDLFSLDSAQLENTDGSDSSVESTSEGTSATIPSSLFTALGDPTFLSVVIMAIYSNFISSGVENTRRSIQYSTRRKFVGLSHLFNINSEEPGIPFVPSQAVTALTLYGEDGLPLNGVLDDPVLIEVPYLNVTYFSKFGIWKQLQCSVFNRTENIWHSTTCTLKELKENSVVCACYSLGPVKVDTILNDHMDIPPSDPATWVNLTTIICAGVSIILFGLASVIAYVTNSVTTKNQTNQHVRKPRFLQSILHNHLYISVFIPTVPQFAHFTKIERVWIIGLTWFSFMGWNALFYGEIHHIFVIASAAITLGCTLVLQFVTRFVFEVTGSFKKVICSDNMVKQDNNLNLLLKIMLRRPVVWKWVSILNYIWIALIICLAIAGEIVYGYSFEKFEAGMWVLAVGINLIFDFVVVQTVYSLLQSSLWYFLYPEQMDSNSYGDNTVEITVCDVVTKEDDNM